MFNEDNFKLAVRLLHKNNLDVNRAEIVADMLEYYSEVKINRWLSKLSISNDPDLAFDILLVTDDSSPIKEEGTRSNHTPRRQEQFSMGQHSCGVKDGSGLEGRYSCTLNFAEIFNDPNIYYGTWEETPTARRRFR